MKSYLKPALAIVITAFVFVSMVTCVNQDIEILGREANLVSLRIGNVWAEDIPLFISAANYNSEDEMFDYPRGTMEFNKPEDITSARIYPRASKGAMVEWGIGSRSMRPDFFYDMRVPTTFEDREYVYIKVTSEDRNAVNYYRFYASVFSWVTDLASISVYKDNDDENDERFARAVGGYNMEADDLIGDIYQEPSDTANLSLANGEALGAIVRPTTFDPNATVEIARVTGAGAPTNFQSADVPINFADQDILYVLVTAQNTVDKKLYKFRVSVGRMATIRNLIFIDGTEDVELFGKGLPNAIWVDAGPGDYATADQPSGGYDLKLVFDDPEATAEFVLLPAGNTSQPGTFSTSDVVNDQVNPIGAEFGHQDMLVIRVRAQKTNVTNFYKIRVSLLPGLFKKKPLSNWYYSGAVAEPLVVEMDRPAVGTYTYQWYEADSWYGIYGRHGTTIDEKSNISGVNGGPSMYFYMVDVPEDPQFQGKYPNRYTYGADTNGSKEPWVWKVPDSEGGNTATITPRSDWKIVPIKCEDGQKPGVNVGRPITPSLPKNDIPGINGYQDPPEDWDETNPGETWPGVAPNHFNNLAGNTSEIRYYWCVVTDTGNGRVITSDRAVILTETNLSIEHYIFELTKLPRRKNIAPFRELRELHRIPIPADFFPDGFDPSIYKNCTAIAQYYLPDGSPWTQNWTHGDLHFGYGRYNDKGELIEETESYIANGGPLTWWHNNLGANSGAIPLHTPHAAQGGLEFPPDWIGFAPSGDADRGLPRPDSATGMLPRGVYSGNAYPAGEAQGYFCGFIELLEIRFQK